MMREILCEKCTAIHLPAGVRKIYEESIEGPAEYQRLVLGKAAAPTQAQRTLKINDESQVLDTSHYNCDGCSAAIKPGDSCSARSVWAAPQRSPLVWEWEYLV